MGGPMGVHDHDRHPWLVEERALIAAVAAAGRPVLGVCLGAQQIAAALGAEVSTGPSLEIGFGQVELTADGRRDPVTGPEYGGLADTALPCVHWHHDTFSIPAGAAHLAATRAYPHQAFRWGEVVYGLQFHVEVDRALAAAWTPHLPEGVSLDGPELAQVETVGRRLLGRFVERAAAADAGARTALSPADEPAGERRHRGHRHRWRRCPDGYRGGGQTQAARRLPRGGLLRLPGHRGGPGGGGPHRSAPPLVDVRLRRLHLLAVRGERRSSTGTPGDRWAAAACVGLDHSTIFIAIAGSYTAVAGIALSGWARIAVLCIAWGGALVGITVRQVWLDAPKWVIALPYVVVGWAAVWVLPQLWRALGPTGFTLLLAGGLAYSAGAVVYAIKRPNPVPGVLGYHEVFHACTVVGAGAAVRGHRRVRPAVGRIGRRRTSAGRPSSCRSAGHLAQHVGEDPAVPVVLGLHRRVDPHPDLELDQPVAVLGPDGDRLGGHARR